MFTSISVFVLLRIDFVLHSLIYLNDVYFERKHGCLFILRYLIIKF